jgi:hypothetical protein
MGDSCAKAEQSRRPIRGLLLLLLALGAALAAISFLAGGWILTRATRAVLPRLVAAIPPEHGSIGRIEFDGAEFAPFATAVWNGIAVDARLPEEKGSPSKTLRVRIATATASLRGCFPLRFDLKFDGVRVESQLHLDAPRGVPFATGEFDTPVQRIDDGKVLLPDVGFSGSLRSSLHRELPELLAFARTGITTRRLSMSARLHFNLERVPMSVRLETTREAGGTRLRIHRQDLDTLSRRNSQPLTFSERELLAVNPLRAPMLLRMKDYSQRTARRLARGNSTYDEDSTRHVLWSYWLTRMYGAEFAERTTNAHEEGSDNLPEESERDRHNNGLGREWASSGKTEAQVLKLIREDSRVRQR